MVREGQYFSANDRRFWTKVAETCYYDKMWFRVKYFCLIKALYKWIVLTQTISVLNWREKLIHYKRRKKRCELWTQPTFCNSLIYCATKKTSQLKACSKIYICSGQKKENVTRLSCTTERLVETNFIEKFRMAAKLKTPLITKTSMQLVHLIS